MFTLVQHVPVESFKGLQTENVRRADQQVDLKPVDLSNRHMVETRHIESNGFHPLFL